MPRSTSKHWKGFGYYLFIGMSLAYYLLLLLMGGFMIWSLIRWE